MQSADVHKVVVESCLSDSYPDFLVKSHLSAFPSRLCQAGYSSTTPFTLASRSTPRLSLINRHLDSFSHITTTASPAVPSYRMSSQAAHPTLLIPGPIEFDDEVLLSMAHPR